MDEFARHDYKHASTNRIAEEARIAKGMLFHYFGSKKDLFLYLVDYGIGVIEREYIPKLDEDKAELIEKLRRAVEVKMEATTRNPHVYRFVNALYLDNSVSLPDGFAGRLNELRRVWLARLCSNIDTSMYRDDVPLEHVREIIYWSMEGYQKKLIDSLDRDAVISGDLTTYWEDFDSFLDSLKRILYRQEEDTGGDSHDS